MTEQTAQKAIDAVQPGNSFEYSVIVICIFFLILVLGSLFLWLKYRPPQSVSPSDVEIIKKDVSIIKERYDETHEHLKSIDDKFSGMEKKIDDGLSTLHRRVDDVFKIVSAGAAGLTASSNKPMVDNHDSCNRF